MRQILDNPVYCGKIAYGRRTREKVKGTKNEYKQVHAEDYILEDGQHEGIVSEELWQKVHAKRVATGIKQPSKTGKDRSHLLTGVLKCPLCGSPMYTNKHAWTNKDGTYKEVYYYICGRNKQERGHYCEYKASLRKTDIEPLVIEAIRELVSDKSFAKEIKKRFGVQTDTSKIDKELANYESKLKEVDLNKARLEREIDNLPADAKYRERKIHDMTIRLDGLYDTIVELEERIEDAKLRRSSIEMEAITLENVYRIMENFSKLYAIISDEEKKSLVSYLIKEIQIYPNGTSDRILKSIEFNFPIYRDGREIRKLLWENGNTVDSHFIYVNFKEKSPGVYVVSAYNTSGFSGNEAIAKYLDIVKTEAAEANKAASANAEMKDFSVEISQFAKDDVKVKIMTKIPVSGWSFDDRGRCLVENDDPTAFGAGAIRFEVRTNVEDFDYYKDKFENYQDIEDRVIGGITFKGRTYKYIGYNWIQYVAQIDDGRALSIGLTKLECVPGTMPDIILNNMTFK